MKTLFDVVNIDVNENALIVREVERDDCKNRFFLRIDSSHRPIHISLMIENKKCSLDIVGDTYEYLISRSALPSEFELYEVVNCGRKLIRRYRISDKAISIEELVDTTMPFSTGSPKIDDLIEEISEYREYWMQELCGEENKADLFGAFLMARTSLNYVLTRRLKETWLELSNEYIGFLLAIIHSILSENGYTLLTPHRIAFKCKEASLDKSVSWKNIGLRYGRNNEYITIYLEKMIHGVTPDILAFKNKHRILIECKQGPVNTWLSKAIKQSKKYREHLGGTLVLATSRILSEDQFSMIKQYYEYVIHSCNHVNISKCIESIRNIIMDETKQPS